MRVRFHKCLLRLVLVSGILTPCLQGCRDRNRQLQELVNGELLVNASTITTEKIDACGIAPMAVKNCILSYLTTFDANNFKGLKTCFLRLSCAERTKYVRDRAQLSRLAAPDNFHVQSIAVLTPEGESSKYLWEEWFGFFSRDYSGQWHRFFVRPKSNGLNTSGVISLDSKFLCLERSWWCAKTNGETIASPFLFMSQEFADFFVVEMCASDAKLLYLSSHGIEKLRANPCVEKLCLVSRSPTSMVFLPEKVVPNLWIWSLWIRDFRVGR